MSAYTKSLGKLLLLPLLLAATPALAQKYVCMQSSQGEWCMEMLAAAAPNTVTNFLRYVNNGDYTNNLVHRSVPGFVIQGGGFSLGSDGFIGPVTSYGTIKNEFNRSNLRGTVAMAKLSGNPDSASNQWFVNLGNNSSLDTVASGSFTVFAEVVYGMTVVDKIAGLRVVNLSVALNNGAFGEMPADLPATATTVARDNLVTINRAYATDVLPGTTVLPYHCTAEATASAAALTELCGTSVSFPVNVQGIGAYEVTLTLVTSTPTLVFAIKAGSLKPLTSLPANAAVYTPATQVLVIPSVRTSTAVYDEVQLKLTNVTAQQFTLQSFKRR
jgi:peptidyl-prolyl cis-trans isomerase A (cyclophilin A)